MKNQNDIEVKDFTIVSPSSEIEKKGWTIKQEIPRNVLENIFMTAIEGGSNYWYWLSDLAVKIIRDAVPKEEEPYLAMAFSKAILDHNATIPVNDSEDDFGIVGYISNETIKERLQSLIENKDLRWCLYAELSENGDAETSDVVFQFLAMGEYVYG